MIPAAARIANSPRIAALFLAALRFAKTAFSLASMIISARFFGVDSDRDHFVLCLAVTTTVPQILFGPINEIFRLKYSHLREEEGETSALQRGNAVMSVAFWGLFAVTVVIEMFPQIVTAVFAPALAESEKANFLLMARIVTPLLVINQISSGWVYILNAYKVFFFPEFIGILTSALGIMIVVLFTRWVGIYSLVISLYVSALLLLFALVPLVRRKAMHALRFWRCNAKQVMPFLRMAMPFYFSFALGQGLSVIEKRISGSMGSGMVSVLDYAQKIIAIPLAVLISTITSILAPSLASCHAKSDVIGFRREFIGYLRLTLIVLSPLVFVLSFGGHDILSVVFGRKVDSHGLRLMATTLAWLSMGLVAAAAYSLTGQAITAVDKGRQYAMVGAGLQGLIILLNVVAAPGREVYVLAITWAAAHVVAAAALLLMLDFRAQIADALMQIACVYGFVFGFGYLSTIPFCEAHLILRLLSVGFGAVVGLILSVFVLRMPERVVIRRTCSQLFDKWRALAKWEKA